MDKKLLQKIFGVSQCPIIDFGLNEISQKAQDMTGKLSISGAQPKLSVKFDKRKNILIPAPGGEYLLKPQTSSFPNLPENEQCCMDIAEKIGINVPAHCLVALKDKSLAYLVKRFDRKNAEKIHQEDFSQILEKRDKYSGSVEQVGRKLQEISAVPGLDVQLFFERVVFYFLIGNGDAHLKNYSIAYLDDGQIRLTPAYDIVCSRLVIQDHDSALMINGSSDNLGRKDFDAFAEHFKIPAKVCYDKFIGKIKLMEEMVRLSMLDKNKQEQFIAIIQERYQRMNLL